MPLMHGKSKKAFEHNIKAEMEAGHPQKQSLAIAFNVQRKAKAKKMAKGGEISANNEKRPIPEDNHNDSKQEHQNEHMSPPRKGDSAKLGEDISMQAKRGGKFPLKHPKMVESILSTKLRNEEDHLETSEAPASTKELPAKWMNEEEADKHGPDTPALHMKKMAHGGEARSEAQDIDEEELEHAASLAAAIMAKRKMARGGKILSEDSMESNDSNQVDLARNAEEDANMEDKASFDALRKENYSETDGLDELSGQPHDSNLHGDMSEEEDENDHDKSMVSAIRRKMKSKSPMTR